MAKKHKHEDHLNHEAWAIPYGDLVTLLLALFVVMYSMSAINEGKFRVAADSLNAAFGGKPRSPAPIQIGPSSSAPKELRPRMLQSAPPHQGVMGARISVQKPTIVGPSPAKVAAQKEHEAQVAAREKVQLEKMADKVHEALGDLIAQKLVVVRRNEQWLEVEIQTDILFASGQAQLASAAGEVLDRLAQALLEFDNSLRIEGHTDDIPITTREFPSNWELSSARAASVVHRFMAGGIAPQRMAVLGLAEYHPVVENTDAKARNRNRRVVIVVLANPAAPDLPEFPTAASDAPAISAPTAGAELAAGSSYSEHARP